MNLRDISFKKAYSSDFDDILHDFYIPALEASIEYDRLAGFFSSTSLAIAAKGILGLIVNEGVMKLIVSPKFNKKDLEIIMDSYKYPEKYIERKMLEELEKMEEEIIRDHVSILGWMIANKKLDIKVAVTYNNEGKTLSYDEIQQSGLFHQKVGILKDSNGNLITFSGSINETATSWFGNIEEFKVFRNWVPSEEDYVEADIIKFKKFWNNQSPRVRIMDIPLAVKKKLIEIAPKNIENLKLEPIKKVSKLILKPWSHQEKAIKALRENSYRGIFKMATGTGKTYNAILSLEQYFKDIKKYRNRILIVVPQHAILEQWTENLYDFTLSNDFVTSYYSDTPIKDKRYFRKIWKSRFNKDDVSNTYLVITVGSIKNFKPFKIYTPDFIIGDEVHTYGTENYMNILKEHLGNVKYRLGLSATPERYYDPYGTKRVLNYFGPIIYEYSIKDAQKDGILSNYNYYPFLVELTPWEEEEIEELTKKIRKDIAIDFKNELSERENFLSTYAKYVMIERAKIIKKADNKLNAFRKILEKNKGKLKQCIIYCEDNEQLNNVQKVFDDLKIDSYIKYHSEILNRQEALSLFKTKNCNFILSIRCLDQGVNIPSCESLILLSSSGNPRQYIQRRGRVLRNPQNIIKPIVKIFDILAFPRNLKEIYKGLVITQLIRSWEFISCSQSPEEKMKFEKIMDAYNIKNKELKKIISGW